MQLLTSLSDTVNYLAYRNQETRNDPVDEIFHSNRRFTSAEIDARRSLKNDECCSTKSSMYKSKLNEENGNCARNNAGGLSAGVPSIL